MRLQKISVIFSWVIVGLVFLFTLGVVAAIKKWIDRPWATGIAEVSVGLTFLLTIGLFICFFLDRSKEKKPASADPVAEDDSAGLGIDDDAELADEDEFEELEPLNIDADPLEGSIASDAEDLDGI
ncbi:MAG: hypothetical protein CMJ74_06185 [Planctomycetaceae bacterium]|nr:hypothetical protein [Planctomycetaceae bacterium]|tara:strand:- start:2753 stop:3130 length:378 start_codon:yes stop_codon:yes gene_type:complete